MYLKVEFIGNVTADPVVSEVNTKNGPRKVTKFSVAVNDPFNKDADPTFLNDIAAWNGTGENVKKFVSKGDRIFGVCSMQIVTVEKDGEKRRYNNYELREVRFLGSPSGSSDRIPDEVLAASAPPETTAAVETQVAETEAAPAQESLEVPF